MEKMPYSPEQAGYAVTDGIAVVTQRVGGGRGRYRKDIVDPTSIVDVTWRLDREEYRLFRGFYKGVLEEGSLPFLIDLIIDDSTLTEHTANFIPGSMSLDQQTGLTHVVSAQIEVVPSENAAAVGSALFLLNKNYGSLTAANALLIDLETFVNVDLPDKIPA